MEQTDSKTSFTTRQESDSTEKTGKDTSQDMENKSAGFQADLSVGNSLQTPPMSNSLQTPPVSNSLQTMIPGKGLQARCASKAQIQYLKKLRYHQHMVRFLRFLILILLVILWEVSARTGWINAFIFSSPSGIMDSAMQLLSTGSLLSHIGITLAETFSSFFLVIFLSLLTAILLWWNQSLCEILEPYLVILNSLPKSAMAPIFIVWLGNNMKTIIVTAVSVAIFGSILSLFTSFTTTDPDKLKLIRTLGGSRIHCLTKVVLPMNLPSIVSLMKVDIGLCLIGVVIGEFLAAKKGLGYLIIYGSQVFKMDWVLLSIVILCLIAVMLYLGISMLEKKVLTGHSF